MSIFNEAHQAHLLTVLGPKLCSELEQIVTQYNALIGGYQELQKQVQPDLLPEDRLILTLKITVAEATGDGFDKALSMIIEEYERRTAGARSRMNLKVMLGLEGYKA